MPDFEITDSETGNTLIVTGDIPPTPEESEELFSLNASNVITPEPIAEKPRQIEFADPSNPTQEEWLLKEQIDNEQSNLDYSVDILKAIPKGIFQMGKTIVSGIGEGFEPTPEQGGKFKRVKSILEGGRRALWDIGELYEAAEGRIGDIGQEPDVKSERRRQRFIQDVKDADTRNKGLWFDSQQTQPNLTEAMSILADPTNLLPSGLATQALKSTAKVAKAVGVSQNLIKNAQKIQTVVDIPVNLSRAAVRAPIRGGAKVMSFGLNQIQKPIKIIGKVSGKVGDKAGDVRESVIDLAIKAVGASPEQAKVAKGISMWATPFVPGFNSVDKLELGGKATRFASEVAIKKAEQLQNVMSILGDGKKQARFIEAVIEHPNVPTSVKKMASIAGAGGQKTMDMALDAVAGSLSTGALQGVLTSIATTDADAIGQAIGGGGLFGAFGGAISSKSRKGREGGIEASKAINRLNVEQRERLTHMKLDINNQKAQGDLKFKLTKQDQSTLDMLKGSLSDMNIQILEPSMYNLTHKKQTGSEANGKPFFEDENGVIWVDSSHKDITPALIDNYTNRVASDYTANNPNIVNDVVNDFISDTGVQLRAQDGSLVTVGGDMGKMIEAYNKKQPSQQHRINNVEHAVQKYLEGGIDKLFTDSNTNMMKGLKNQPATKMALRDTAHIALGKLGLVDRVTGLPLNKDIPKPAQGLNKNQHVARGVSNLNRLNERINGDNIREQRIHEAELKAKSDTMVRIHNEVMAETQARHDKIGEQVAQNEANAKKAFQEETLAEHDALIKESEGVEKQKVKDSVKGDKKIAKDIADAHKARDKADAKKESDIVSSISKAEKKANQATQKQLLKDLKTHEKQANKAVDNEAKAEMLLDLEQTKINDIKDIINRTVGRDKLIEGTKTKTPENIAWRKRKQNLIDTVAGNDVSIGEVGAGAKNIGTKLGNASSAIKRAQVRKYLDQFEKAIANNSTVDVQGAEVAIKRKDTKAEDQSHTIDPINFRVGSDMKNPTTQIEVMAIDRGAAIARGLDSDAINRGITEIREATKQGGNINDMISDVPDGSNPIIDLMKKDRKASKKRREEISKAKKAKKLDDSVVIPKPLDSKLGLLKSLDPHNMIKVNVRGQ